MNLDRFRASGVVDSILDFSYDAAIPIPVPDTKPLGSLGKGRLRSSVRKMQRRTYEEIDFCL